MSNWILLSFLIALAAGCCAALPVAASPAPGDSAAAHRNVRVFSDRALFDLNPRPAAKERRASTAALDDSLHLPSPGGATAFSMAGTLLPIVLLTKWDDRGADHRALLASGLALAVIGPGLGYAYARMPEAGLPGQLVRLGSLALATWTVMGSSFESEGAVAAAVGTLTISGVAFAGATLYDLGHVGTAVERSNERRRAAATAAGLRTLPGGRPALAFTVEF